MEKEDGLSSPLYYFLKITASSLSEFTSRVTGYCTVLATEIRSPELWAHILAVSVSKFYHPVSGLCDVSAPRRGSDLSCLHCTPVGTSSEPLFSAACNLFSTEAVRVNGRSEYATHAY